MSLTDNEFTTSTSATTREKMLEEKKRKKKERNSFLFPLMNGEFPISILITQVRLSAGLMITRNSISNKSSWFVNMCWGNAEHTYRDWPVRLFLFWKNPTALIVLKYLFVFLHRFYIVCIALNVCTTQEKHTRLLYLRPLV